MQNIGCPDGFLRKQFYDCMASAFSPISHHQDAKQGSSLHQ
jgi:hypothetical protein